jgi:hypothetical protein
LLGCVAPLADPEADDRDTEDPAADDSDACAAGTVESVLGAAA